MIELSEAEVHALLDDMSEESDETDVRRIALADGPEDIEFTDSEADELFSPSTVACIYEDARARDFLCSQCGLGKPVEEWNLEGHEVDLCRRCHGVISETANDDPDQAVVNAVSNVLMYASDQLAHVEDGHVESAAYVGRHLEQAWLSYDSQISNWLEARFQLGVDQDLQAEREQLVRRLKRGAPIRPEAHTLMARLIHATGDVLNDELVPAVERGDVAAVAAAAYLARRWFTKYRTLKWRWLEQNVGEVPAYQWFEA